MAVITFTPLYGVQSEGPLCFLLEIDEVCILLDCGWTDQYDEAMLQPLRRVIPRIDLVLISHPDLAHLGALPYAVGKLGLKAPIYGTLPVNRMGQITMYDSYQARQNSGNFNLFDLDDIDSVFENFKQLKYSEKLTLTNTGEGIVITPHAAGHLIGGSLWKITKETDEIIYAVDYNHKTEHVLGKTVLDSFIRPTLLITDSMNMPYEQPKLKDRDSKIMKNILDTIRNGGNVLFPSDSSGRVLELMRVLDQYWIQHKLSDPIVLLHDMSYYVSKGAQAMLEWCNERISKNFDVARHNPFQFTYVNLIHSIEDLDRLPSPKVVISTSSSLECGYAKELFVRWAPDPKNRIILTTRSPPNTLSRTLMDDNQAKSLDIEISRKVPLEGLELLNFEAKQRRKELEDAEERAKEEEEAAIEDMIMGIEDYESDSDDEKNQKQLRGNFKVGFGQFATSKYPLFSTMERKMEWDEYGEIINPEDYMDKYALNRPSKHARKAGLVSEEPMDVEEDNHIPSVPTKTVVSTITVQLRASVVFIDFEGLADGKAIKNCLSTIKPRKLILVHGTPETTEELKQYVERNITYCEAVFCPKPLECIDIESDTSVYKVKLKESLYAAANFETVGNNEVAFIDARMEFPQESPMPILHLLPPEECTGHEPILLSEGTVKLDLLKQRLVREGFHAEFRGGMVVCRDGVALKKTKSNGIVIEGPLCENYFKIRNVVYGEFTMI